MTHFHFLSQNVKLLTSILFIPFVPHLNNGELTIPLISIIQKKSVLKYNLAVHFHRPQRSAIIRYPISLAVTNDIDIELNTRSQLANLAAFLIDIRAVAAGRSSLIHSYMML